MSRSLREKNTMPLLVTILALAAAGAAQEEGWPQWRGPGRDGVVRGFSPPASWPSALVRRWSVPAGAGHASPVHARGRLYLFAREGDEETLRCLDPSDGHTLFRAAAPVSYKVHPAAVDHGPGPKATPLIAGGRVVTLSIDGTVSSWDAGTGALAWRRDFAGEFKASSPLFGSAASPAYDAGRILAHVGGHDSGAFVALDAETGATIWRWDGDGPGYASPVVAELGGVRQIVTQSQAHLIGLDAATGALLWKIPFTTPYVQNIVTPVVFGQTVLFSGLDNGLLAIRPVKSGAAWAAETAWKTSEISMYMNSPVLAAGRLCGLSHLKKGQFFCANPATGAAAWLGEGGQGEQAATVASGDLVFHLMDGGELIVVRASGDNGAPIARYKVSESPTWAHPVFMDGDILIKDAGTLSRWSFGPPPAPAPPKG